MGSLVKGMIGKEDLNLASDDKYPSTFTRLASTGSTVTMTSIPDAWITHRSGVNAKYYGDHTATGTTLLQACGQIGTTTKTLLHFDRGEWTISSDCDASEYTNIYFDFSAGAYLAISAGITLTLPSPTHIISSHTQQIFAGTGSVIFSEPGNASGWWAGQSDEGIQKMIDSVETCKGGVVFDGIEEYETAGGLKFYSGQTLTWGSNTTFKMTAASGFVMRLAESSTVTVPTSGPLDEPHLIYPKINMDAKGDAGILIECAENAVVEYAKITNVPSGTFNYDDGDGSGAQAYDKAGIIVKGIQGVYGCYYTSLIKPIVLGVSAASKGQTGILLTTTTGQTTQLPNQTYIEKPESRMFVYGIRILQETASTTIINPECSTNTTGIDDDGEGTVIISPQLENGTTGIDSDGASRAFYFGRGSTSVLTTAWQNTGSNKERNTWWRSTSLVVENPDDGAGGLETYANIKRVSNITPAGTRSIRIQAADSTDDPVDTLTIARIGVTDAARISLDPRGDFDKPVFLRLARAGSSVANTEVRHAASDEFARSIAAYISTGGPDGLVICLTGSDNTVRWVNLSPTMIKADGGDPAYHYGEGTICINTNDNTAKIYADGGWRTIASGW